MAAMRSTSLRLPLWACGRSVTPTVQPDNAQTKGKIAQIGYLLQVTEQQ